MTPPFLPPPFEPAYNLEVRLRKRIPGGIGRASRPMKTLVDLGRIGLPVRKTFAARCLLGGGKWLLPLHVQLLCVGMMDVVVVVVVVVVGRTQIADVFKDVRTSLDTQHRFSRIVPNL